MTSNIIDLPVITTLDTNPSRVLAKAAETAFERVVIVGVTETGERFFAASAADGGSVLWDIEQAKRSLLQIGGE